jgi:hypothetical protein
VPRVPLAAGNLRVPTSLSSSSSSLLLDFDRELELVESLCLARPEPPPYFKAGSVTIPPFRERISSSGPLKLSAAIEPPRSRTSVPLVLVCHSHEKPPASRTVPPPESSLWTPNTELSAKVRNIATRAPLSSSERNGAMPGRQRRSAQCSMNTPGTPLELCDAAEEILFVRPASEQAYRRGASAAGIATHLPVRPWGAGRVQCVDRQSYFASLQRGAGCHALCFEDPA